jgi:hypothetical protein
VLDGLHRIASQGAWLEVLIGIDEDRDAREAERLRLPALTDEYLQSPLSPRYAQAGFDVRRTGLIPQSEWQHLETTWAKRLRGNDRRRMVFVVARAE